MTTLTASIRSVWPGLAHYWGYVELSKPRIATMVLVTVAAAAFLACWGQPDPLTVLHAVLGTGLVAVSASVANQVWERRWDARMKRTARRPLPSGRLTSFEATVFTAALLLAGTSLLLAFTTPLAALLACATWLLYVTVYTPMKRSSSWNTLVGAIPGAAPVLIGWTATGQPLDLRAWALFLLVFFWQFPHFMAIAWRYRRDYESAGFRMLTVVDPTGKRAGIQAVLGAIALVPTCLVLTQRGTFDLWSPLILLALSGWFLAAAIRFLRHRDDVAATRLLRTSLVYLPAALATVCITPWL